MKKTSGKLNRQPLRTLLKRTRVALKLSPHALAKKVGVSSGRVISNWEKGMGSRISPVQLKKLSRHLKLPPTQLVDAFLLEERQRLSRQLKSK